MAKLLTTKRARKPTSHPSNQVFGQIHPNSSLKFQGRSNHINKIYLLTLLAISHKLIVGQHEQSLMLKKKMGKLMMGTSLQLPLSQQATTKKIQLSHDQRRHSVKV